jgi:16S rRNA (guanine527-N7)-methyltransferase
MTSVLERYAALLLKWNARINLTAAASHDDAMQHIRDCEAIVPHIPADSRSLVDIGSGGGLPAVVIAAARPDLIVHAIEPTQKKHAFLRTAARELGLPNLLPRAARLEDVESDAFDVASSRATFAIDEWLTRGLRLVHVGGTVLGMEGQPVALPPGAVRHPYRFGDKTRAIVTLVRST